MVLNFGKKMLIGVSVTPEVGIEVAQIDYNSFMVQAYASKPFECDIKNPGMFDLDMFKNTLSDLLIELQVPIGSEIVLNLPTNVFGIRDVSASFNPVEVSNYIEDEILATPMFQMNPGIPCFSYHTLPNSTIQFNKTVFAASYMNVISEIAIQIRDLKYKLVGIDTSIASMYNALMYTNRLNVPPEASWVMLVIDGAYARILTLQGNNFVDCFEEKINIGKILDDAENYASVVSAVAPILKNLPSSLLYIVSKTEIVSAKILADKLTYNSQIAYQEDNIYNSEPFLNLATSIPQEIGKRISLDVIGAAIKKDYSKRALVNLNLFNESLGDIYLSQTPPTFKGIELSVENMIKFGIGLLIFVLIISIVIRGVLNKNTQNFDAEAQNIQNEIREIDKFLEQNKDISTSKFSESDEIRLGIAANKNIYTYYTIVGTEIPKKLWLTELQLGNNVIISGQADNLESVYAFYRNIKDYNPAAPIKLQKLNLASNGRITSLDNEGIEADKILTSMNADFYEFKIADTEDTAGEASAKPAADNKPNSKGNKLKSILPDLEPLE